MLTNFFQKCVCVDKEEEKKKKSWKKNWIRKDEEKKGKEGLKDMGKKKRGKI